MRFAVDAGVLRFGEFKTKAGRLSPYFFNAGGFDDGAKLGRLASFYARRLLDSGLRIRHAVRPGLQGHHAGRRGGDRAGAAGAQRAVRLQPQGSQGPRRGGHAGRRAAGRPRGDRRRRDLGRHLGARVDRADPRPRAHDRSAWPSRWTVRSAPPRAASTSRARPCSTSWRNWGCTCVAIATLADLLEYLSSASDAALAPHAAARGGLPRPIRSLSTLAASASTSTAAGRSRSEPGPGCSPVLARGAVGRRQQAPSLGAKGIYTCVDDNGQTPDRPTARSSSAYDREQRILNTDGSLQARRTADADGRRTRRTGERASARQPKQRRLTADAVNRDRNLMIRYPRRRVAPEGARGGVDDVRIAMRTSEQRLRELGQRAQAAAGRGRVLQGQGHCRPSCASNSMPTTPRWRPSATRSVNQKAELSASIVTSTSSSNV